MRGRVRGRQGKRLYLLYKIVVMPLFLFLFVSCIPAEDKVDLSMYEYRDTRNLVKFAYNAARMLEKGGLDQIQHFKENRSFYNRENFYLYIHDLKGKNIFHAGEPEMEGQDLYQVTDINGKKITQLVLGALQDKENPHAWVHYSWWEPDKFYPITKSSCHFKVVTPEGKELLVGAGMNYPHEEKEFIRVAVDSAVDLINREGRKAFEVISERESPYIYREVKVFIFDSQGNTIVSPVAQNIPAEINFIESYDDAGHQPFKRALEDFKTQDRSWQVVMSKSRDKRSLVKKPLYVCKTMLGGKVIYVGAITGLPQPPWTD